MALGIDFTFTQSQLRSLSKRLEGLVKRAGNLTPFFDDASAYMVNVIQHRIYRSKKSPDGADWAPLADSTVDIKGHDTILYETGNLGRSIHVDAQDRSGFIIASDAPYAYYMQNGVKRTGGMIKGKRVPARPFMGISERNVKVISKMLKDHVAGRAGGAPAGGGFE
jgi:phage virion morphogenesis protein